MPPKVSSSGSGTVTTTSTTYIVPTPITTNLQPKKSEICKPPVKHNNSDDVITWFAALTTYLSYAVLILFGHLRDFLGKITGKSRYFNGSGTPPKVSVLFFLYGQKI